MSTSPVIVGGGPAGAAAAIALARGGARPLLLERHAEPHDCLCGGFLGWDALGQLAALGIDTAALGARPIDRVRLIGGERVIERPLPGVAAGLSRGALDSALIAAAAHAGAAIERGIAVREAVGSTELRLDDGATIATDSVFLATGKRDLRGLARPRAAGDDPAVGLRLRLGPIAEVEGVIELHLFGPRLCRPASPGGWRDQFLPVGLALAARRSRRPTRTAGRQSRHGVAAAGRSPVGAADPPDAGGRRRALRLARRTGAAGLFRLGDQAGVIASLAGDGVAIALASGWTAGTAWLDGGPAAAPAWQSRFARRLARPIRISEMLRGVAQRRPERLLQLAGVAPWLVGLAAAMTRIDH